MILAIFSETNPTPKRKIHLVIDGVDGCAFRKRFPHLLWDESEIANSTLVLLAHGVNPYERVCSNCHRAFRKNLLGKTHSFAR